MLLLCRILLDWCGVWPELLHWSGFCRRCLSPCWTGGHGSPSQRSWSCTTGVSYQYSCMVRPAGQYLRRTHARSMHSTSGVCVCCLASMVPICTEWWVRRLMKQPKLTAIIQSRRLTLFGHIMRMDNNADAKKILLASPPADWRRQLGCPRITWLSTVQQDVKQHHLTLPEAADLAQNRPLWRMMPTYGAMQSCVACQKRRRLLSPAVFTVLIYYTPISLLT